MTLRRPSAFGGAIAGSIANQLRMAKLRQLELPVPIRRPHHYDVDPDIVDPIDAIHPRPLNPRLAFNGHAERGEEGDGGRQVVDDDAHVVQPFDDHAAV